EHIDARVIRRDTADAPLPGGVALRVHAHAQEPEGGEGVGAHVGGVLADPGGEGDHVHAAQLGDVGAEVGAQSVDVDVVGEGGGPLPRGAAGEDVAHVAASRQAHQSAALVEQD